MQEAQPQSPVAQQWSRWRGFVLGYAFLAVIWVASGRATSMTTLEFGAFALVLSLPAMAALWHQSTVRQLVRMHQFAPGSGMRWLASRRVLSILVRAILALVLTGTVLMQMVLFGRLEWVLLLVSPLLYIAASSSLDHYLGRQFTRQAYARRWVFWATQALLTILLTLVWLGAHVALAEPPSRVIAEVVFDLQQRWAGSPSGLVKWALDASAWVQAIIDALKSAPNTPRWQLVLSLFFTPLAVFGYMSLTLSGLSLPISEVRRTVGEPLTDADAPPPVGPIRAATWAAVTAIGVMFFFQTMAAFERLIDPQESPFAVQQLPECERIAGAVYRVNTISILETYMGTMDQLTAGQKRVACAGMNEIEAAAAKGVDAYLDWYFSLGADWARTLGLLTGGADALLQEKFQTLVLSDPAIESRLKGMEVQFDSLSKLTVQGKRIVDELLEKQRLVVTDQQCKVVRELTENPWTPKFDNFSARLATGSGVGVLSGVIAAKITSKAMAKTSMKLAGKALLKVAAKKSTTKIASTLAGAALGSAIPVIGTAAGAIGGFVFGAAVGVAADKGMLLIDERLNRPEMKADLLASFTETLQPYRDSLACSK